MHYSITSILALKRTIALLAIFATVFGPISSAFATVDETPSIAFDACVNINDIQETVPAGMTASEGVCIEAVIVTPPVDVCTNMEGLQSVVPDGMTENDGECTALETPVSGCMDESANNYDSNATVDNESCTFDSDETNDAPTVVNTCLLPSTLGDENTFTMNSSGEKTLSEMLTDHGYTAINPVSDQFNYQVWNLADNTADSITFSMRVLGKRAGNTEVVGYYKAGNTLTFTSVLTQVDNTDGEATVSVTIPAAFANSFGFALQSADKTWFSEVSLNTDAKDHVAVYNPSTNKYLLAYEDFNNLGDSDYNDIVIEVSGVTCDHNEDGAGDRDTYKLFGTVWHDTDEDDVIDEDEDDLAGWTVRAVNASNSEDVYTDETDDNGGYELNVPAGKWIISELTESGWVLLSDVDTVNGAGTYTVTVPAPVEVTLLDWFIPTAEAATLASFGPYNFGNIVETTTTGTTHHRRNSGGANTVPAGAVLGDSTAKAPAGEVLGASTTTLPVGAPNTGAGGTSTTPTGTSSYAMILVDRTTVRKVK